MSEPDHWNGQDEDLPSMENADAVVRDEFETIVLAQGCQSASDQHLHLPSEGDEPKLCQNPSEHGWRQKPVEVYPPGFRPICPYCWYIFNLP